MTEEIGDDSEVMSKVLDVLDEASARIKGLKNGATAPEVEQELSELRRFSRTLVQDHANDGRLEHAQQMAGLIPRM